MEVSGVAMAESETIGMMSRRGDLNENYNH